MTRPAKIKIIKKSSFFSGQWGWNSKSWIYPRFLGALNTMKVKKFEIEPEPELYKN
jgi:hypothetical protein